MSLKPTRLPKLLALARGRDCARCDGGADTVVAAHYQGWRSHSYGKGRGIKPHDALAAHLCHRCHSHADTSGLASGREAHSQQFLLLVIATQLTLWQEGRVAASPAADELFAELAGNAAALLQWSEDDLHRTALLIAEAWDIGSLRVCGERLAMPPRWLCRGGVR